MFDLKDIKQFLIKWNDENVEDYYKASMEIWENPELAMQEYISSGILKNLLKKNEFDVEENVGDMPTAFIASYGKGRPVIGINAEYDALPGLSQDNKALVKKPVKENAPGHGCGHNLLGTGGVKAAIAIKNAMEKYKLPGTVKIIGAPAEELCIGKTYLGKAGLLNGFDAILDWHPWYYTKTNYDSCQAYFSVKYHFKGKASHGNSPWNGRSALDAAILQAHSVEMLREHLYPGNPPDAVNTINYTFSSDGFEFPSVIPEKTTAWYIGRFTTTEEMLEALEKVTKCAKAATLATETDVEREIVVLTHHKIPNKTLSECFRNNMLEVGVPKFTEEEHRKAKAIQKEMGCPQTGLPTKLRPFESGFTVLCDTSEYSWNAPFAAPWIAMAVQDCGWHNWGITRCAGDTMGQKSMDCAAKVISMTAIDLICCPEILEKAQNEWKERLGGRKYECLLPDEMKPPIHLNKDVMDKYRKRS